MVSATRVEAIAPGIYRWAAHSPQHRVELTSHGVWHKHEFHIFDPIPVTTEALHSFPPVTPSSIILTNGNHERAAAGWRERFGIPVYTRMPELLGHSWIRRLVPGAWPLVDWSILDLSGGAEGETAFVLGAASLAVFGDAVVNLADRQLELLPDKYCSDPPRLRKALTAMLSNCCFENALVAHGAELIGEADARIRRLLSPYQYLNSDVHPGLG